MAESLVQVTEGSGKKLHTNSRTIGANTVEDEYVLHGEPGLATYTATTVSTGTATTTALSHLFQIMAGASLNLYIRRIKITQLTMATTAAMSAIVLTRLTTAGTGGTAVTPAALDSSDGAAGATAMTLPTVKGTNGATLWDESVLFVQTIGASTTGIGPVMDIDFEKLRGKALRIPAGTTNGLAVQLQTGIAGATVIIVCVFSEATF
jgi:hypothetical protein